MLRSSVKRIAEAAAGAAADDADVEEEEEESREGSAANTLLSSEGLGAATDGAVAAAADACFFSDVWCPLALASAASVTSAIASANMRIPAAAVPSRPQFGRGLTSTPPPLDAADSEPPMRGGLPTPRRWRSCRGPPPVSAPPS